MTPLGIDPATFRFAAQCLKHCTTSSVPPHHHVRAEYNTIGNKLHMDNGTRPSEFQATEEELAASQYELSEVEALLLHLNDRKRLLLERIGRLNGAILLGQNW
jgi:hypothetical protein